MQCLRHVAGKLSSRHYGNSSNFADFESRRRATATLLAKGGHGLELYVQSFQSMCALTALGLHRCRGPAVQQSLTREIEDYSRGCSRRGQRVGNGWIRNFAQ